MSDLSHFMGREQQARADFVAAMAQMRPYPPTPPEGPPAFDAMTQTAFRFGICDLRTRQADRLNALGINEEEAATLRESARAENERGLVALMGVRPFADALAAQEVDETTLASWRELSPQIRADWRDIIKDLEVEPEVVGEIAKAMDKACDAIDESGGPGLGRHLSAAIDELEGLRRSDEWNVRLAYDQRADAVPVVITAQIIAKILCIVAILGLTLAMVLYLLSFGAQWYDFYLIALCACVMTLIVVLGC